MKKFLLTLLLVFFPLIVNAQNLSGTTCSGNGCIDINVESRGTIGFQVTGTWSGTLTFRASVDGTTFVDILSSPSTSTTPVTTTTANGAWQATIAGYKTFRVIFTAYSSGTAVVSQRTTSARAGFGGSSGIVNPFNQSLNTTDSVQFEKLKLSNTNTPEGEYIFEISDTFTESAGSSFKEMSYTNYQIDSAVNNNTTVFGQSLDVNLIGSGDSNSLFGKYRNVFHRGTGDLTFLYGDEIDYGTRDGGNINTASAYAARLLIQNAGIITSVYAFGSDVTVPAASQVTNLYAFHSFDLMNKSSNPYAFWYDGGAGSDCNSGGVYRINQFGISAYYNPCFTKYTPSSANFERIIQRWGDTGVFGADNRAYLGVEVGGTGTDRPVNLIGANYSVTSTLTPAVTDTSANSCGSGTQTLAGNDNVGKVTVIGSAGTSCTVTFATAFSNAPSCMAVNEGAGTTTVKAVSTTTTVVLSGVFNQNDVIAYMCMGR